MRTIRAKHQEEEVNRRDRKARRRQALAQQQSKLQVLSASSQHLHVAARRILLAMIDGWSSVSCILHAAKHNKQTISALTLYSRLLDLVVMNPAAALWSCMTSGILNHLPDFWQAGCVLQARCLADDLWLPVQLVAYMVVYGTTCHHDTGCNRVSVAAY